MEKIKDFLFLNLSDYENIGINLPIGAIIIVLSAVMILAAFCVNYQKSCASVICSRLLRLGAISEEKGRGLRELRLNCSLGVKIALRGGGELGSVVKRAGERKMSYGEYISASKKKGFKNERADLDNALFYISPDSIDRAHKIAAENNSVLMPVIITAVLVGALVLAVLFLPDLLSLLNK